MRVPLEPYELRLDGELIASGEGAGWQDRPRVVIQVRGTSNPDQLALVGVGFDVHQPQRDGWLFLPTLAGQQLEVHCDGRMLFTEPEEAPAAQEGGEQ